MAYFSSFSLFAFLALLTVGQAHDLSLTIFNNCPYKIWPAIQPNSGMPVLENGGFELDSGSHRTFTAPSAPWAGRVWARTSCADNNGQFSCATGDCGGKLECNGQGGDIASIAELNLHPQGEDVAYQVSLVDGYNLPVTVTPHEGQGQCPVVGCQGSLLDSCPNELQIKSSDGKVVGCKSGCKALGTPEECCTGDFNTPDKCKPTSHSEFFKKNCPNGVTFPFDKPSVVPQCSAPKELKVIFCQ